MQIQMWQAQRITQSLCHKADGLLFVGVGN